MSAILAFCFRLLAAMLIIVIVRAVTHEAWSHRSFARLVRSRKGRVRKARNVRRAAVSPWGEP